MNNDIRELTYVVEQRLNLLLLDIQQATDEAVATNDLATVASHFQELRNKIGLIEDALKPISSHVEQISRDILPTMFMNKGMKTGNFVGIGRVTINTRWSASMINPLKAIEWLKAEGNGGVVKETVHHETLGAMAKEAAAAGKPMPSDLFKIGTSSYTSVTKA